MSEVRAYAAQVPLPAPASALAAPKAKPEAEKTAEQALTRKQADSVHISPQAQALLAATKPPV